MRMLGYDDVWMPLPGRGAARLPERMAELKRLATEAGRGRIPVWVYGFSLRPESMPATEMGVDAAIIAMPDGNAEIVLRIVEALGRGLLAWLGALRRTGAASVIVDDSLRDAGLSESSTRQSARGRIRQEVTRPTESNATKESATRCDCDR
jgi:hypothetical protein